MKATTTTVPFFNSRLGYIVGCVVFFAVVYIGVLVGLR